MAFRVPKQTVQQQNPYSTAPRPAPLRTSEPAQTNYNPEEDESKEWVLFSPEEEARSTVSARTRTVSTERTPRTAGLSRLSDFGSLNTAAQSSGPVLVGRDVELDTQSGGFLDDNITDLDSLDDGLHAFREPDVYGPAPSSDKMMYASDPAVLPAHDGLGTFAPSGSNVQNQLWQHEQYNPWRTGETRPRRRSSVQRHLDTVDETPNVDMGHDKWQRVENWRMEQSKALLQEIEKETKRRQRKRARIEGSRSETSRYTPSDFAEGIPETPGSASSNAVKPGNQSSVALDNEPDPEETFWRRITRKVIKGLMGIDDSLLSVILGESLVTETESSSEAKYGISGSQESGRKSSTTTYKTEMQEDMDEAIKSAVNSSDRNDWWQERLLERISRELGILVHHFYEHPDTFSTYLRATNSASNEYAGMPISRPSVPSSNSIRSRGSTLGASTQNATSIQSPAFPPALQDAATSRHAALWGIEEEDPLSSHPQNAAQRNGDQTPIDPSLDPERFEREREYWERELDINMVFRYLRSRFVGRASSDTNQSSTAHTQQHQPEDPSYRAEIIRQHHPLVARAQSNARIRQASPLLYHRLRRPSSSCASQSTRVSVSTKRTLPLGSGSSRHYWDIGGSVGSNSVSMAVGGGMGGWGDA